MAEDSFSHVYEAASRHVGFTLKTHQMFSLHTATKKVFNPTFTAARVILDCCLGKTRVAGYHDYRSLVVF